jgi:glutaryl-CoA dehydrogenase
MPSPACCKFAVAAPGLPGGTAAINPQALARLPERPASPMAFEELDYLDLSADLTDDERLLKETVRSFVDKELMPHIEHHFEAGTFPTEIIPKFGELGLLGASMDGYGCTDAGPIGYGLICQELERCDSGVRSFASVQTSLVIFPIFHFGSEEQKQKWIPRLAKGEAIGCFGLTEHKHGSNPGGMETVARADGDHYVLDGGKMWITNGSVADVAVVWAKLDGQVRGFLVEKGTPGFETRLIKNKFSLRASVTSELIFRNCRIPKENLLPGSTVGLKAPLTCLSSARYGICWGAVGAAQACFDEAMKYARDRIQFDRPIAQFQLVQRKFALMATEITKAQLLCMQLGRLKRRGELKHYQISMAKRNNVEMALEVARTCRDILGAAGICYDFQVARHLLNLESVNTYEGTSDIHMLVVGLQLTGLNAIS